MDSVDDPVELLLSEFLGKLLTACDIHEVKETVTTPRGTLPYIELRFNSCVKIECTVLVFAAFLASREVEDLQFKYKGYQFSVSLVFVFIDVKNDVATIHATVERN